jgi:predicted permease
MGDFRQDVRYALRTFLRAPGFTLAALASIAIGVGANTAIFSVASALLLRPLPYAGADRLAILWNRSPGLGITEDWFSTAQYFDILNGHSGFDALAIAIGGNYNLTGRGEPERVGTIRVSSSLLPMLGVRPALGRLFAAADDAPGAPGKAVLGHGTWMRRFGGDSRVVGRAIVLNGQPYEIVGVAPETFALPREVLPTLGGAEDAEVLLSLPLGADAATIRTREDYNILGRLARGVAVEHAQAEMNTITARLRRDHPDVYPPNGGLTFSIVPLQEAVVGDVRRIVLLLFAAVGVVLLIACANVANLLLSRATARQREIAVRAAIGAGRGRIVRQLLTESMVLAIGGGFIGLALARALLEGIRLLGTASVPRLREIAIDGQVLAFTLALSVLAGLLFGLAPAWRLGRRDLHGNLKDGTRGSEGAGALWGRRQATRRLLVVSELALSVMLMVGAGLLVRSFVRLQQVPPGFDPDGVLTFELTMSGRRYNDAQAVLAAYRDLWPRYARLPGVSAAGGVSALPLSQMFAWGPITVEGRTPPPGEKFINADQRMVGGRYFEAMSIPLLAGRLFEEGDTRDQPRVVIVDEHMAQQFWPDESAVGKRIRLGGEGSDSPWMTIVGVVGRVKQYTLDTDSRIAMYVPHTQVPARAMNVVLRSATEPAALTLAARQVLREIDPDLPMYRVRTMVERVGESLARRRFATLLFGLFAGLALGLAVVGVYGVLAYLVDQGTREIGIRMALGATPGGVLWLIVRHALVVALAGVGVGLAAAAVASRGLGALLFGVEAGDPLTFVLTPAILLVVALAASYLPARRAARIDPMACLRSE